MNFNWNVASSIGTILCAFATFLACFISLYQTRISNRKIIKLRVLYDNVLIESSGRWGEKSETKYMGLSITNIGNKTIIVCGFGYLTSKKEGLYYINPHFCTDGNIIPFSEHVLEPEKSLSYNVEKEIMEKYLFSAFKSIIGFICFVLIQQTRFIKLVF